MSWHESSGRERAMTKGGGDGGIGRGGMSLGGLGGRSYDEDDRSGNSTNSTALPKTAAVEQQQEEL